MTEILGKHKYAGCSNEQKANLAILLGKVNQLRADWGEPLKVTSGLRTFADMERIYGKGKSYPIKSKHLFGQAVDLGDASGELMSWLKADNNARMKKYGLWGELHTQGWVHVQIVPHKSYVGATDLRWFLK